MRIDQQAAQTWDRAESLEATNARIHDGVDGDEALADRAAGFVKSVLLGRFPQATPRAAAEILEIGSGVGWIMEAMNRYLCEAGAPPKRIIGLDIAANMSAKARQRLGAQPPYDFMVYDGISVPQPDSTLDLIYSIACLQHIPRPYVFNLFFEIRRLLKPDGFAVLHLMSTDCLDRQELMVSWRREIANQVNGKNDHWHHFYTKKELTDVLAITGFPFVSIFDDEGGTLIVCVSNSSFSGGYSGERATPESAELVALREDNAALKADNVAVEAGNVALRAELAAIRGSTSWHITAPMRWLVKAVRGA